MSLSVLEELINEEKEKIIKKTIKENIKILLLEKFFYLSKDIKEELESIDDIDILTELLRNIIKKDTIEEFKELLNKAKNIDP